MENLNGLSNTKRTRAIAEDNAFIANMSSTLLIKHDNNYYSVEIKKDSIQLLDSTSKQTTSTSRFINAGTVSPIDVTNNGFLLQPFRKPKRVRTAFSPTQLLKLEHAFEENHYVVGAERKQLAQNLSLTETQVKVWFQNRRTKHKRMQQEGDSDSKSQKGSQSGDNEGKNEGSQTSFEDQDKLVMADGEVDDEEEDEVIDMDDYVDNDIDAMECRRIMEHFQEMEKRYNAQNHMFQQQSPQHEQFLQHHFLQQQPQQQQLYAQSEKMRQQQQQQHQQTQERQQHHHQQQLHQQQTSTQKQ